MEDSRGSTVILALSILIITSIMAGAALRVVSVQSKVAQAHKQMEMLRQAADGGIQVARMVVMNYLAARQDLPPLDDIYLDNGIKVEISCQPGSINGRKVVEISSRAYQPAATGSKLIQAQILTDGLPAYAVQAKSLMVSGSYRATVSHQSIDEDMNQDWAVSGTEARLDGDDPYPQAYPCHGPSYSDCEEACSLNHPFFIIQDQYWPGLEPDYTWKIDYAYDDLEGTEFHQLDESLITITPFYEPYGYLELLDENAREEIFSVESGFNDAFVPGEEALFRDELTHQSELKNYAYNTQRVENACVEFDPISLKPTYKLTTGMPGQSNAFEIAIRLGMDQSLVQQARELVPQREKEVGNMIRQLKESHYALDRESREVMRIKEELIKEKEQLDKARKDLEQERLEVISRAREEGQRELRRVKQEAAQALLEFKELLKDKEKTPKWHEIEEKRQKIKQIQVHQAGEEMEARETNGIIKEGDYVLIKNIKQKGYVLGSHGAQGELSVQVGSMKFNVRPENLVKLEQPVSTGQPWRGESFLHKAQSISKEIDIRGKLSEDAVMEIDKYLADALLVGLDSVRLIHGKGTGALRNAVQKYLKTHPQVKAFRDGLPEEGGHGVTVVVFK
jgi:hypothetical protein